MSYRKILPSFSLLFWVAVANANPPATPDATDFFETQVRPVLAEHCHSCHGPKRQQAGLRLDERAAALKGSDTGPAILPNNPDKSPLIQVIRYQGEIKMPPKGKLPEKAVAALTRWVQLGAPWPENAKPALAQAAKLSPAKHWAFQPVQMPALPTVRNRSWPQNPVDLFILAKLEANQLEPAAAADRRTLIRRVTFDLIGLPPTQAEIDAFVHDPAKDAYARLVDRLLASPQYGEKWARHWLDVARYADTKGYVFQEERRYPYAYTYRDYTINAFNRDLPYNRFILEQLAADRLPLGEDKHSLAAMGFLTLGRRFLNNVHDIIDDRIDVVSRGLLGLTVGCARCHDHKFDPIPTKDYYSLYGVFASSVEPGDLPLLAKPTESAEYAAFEKELSAREAKASDFLKLERGRLQARFRGQIPDYLIAGWRPEAGRAEQRQAAGDLNQAMIRRWRNYLTDAKARQSAVFAPWFALAALPQAEFENKAAATLEQLARDAKTRSNPVVLDALNAKALTSLAEVAARYGELFSHVRDPKADPANPVEDEVWQVIHGPQSPLQFPAEDMRMYLDRASREKLNALRREVEQWKATSPVAPARAMVLNDAPTPQSPRVFLRGNPGNIGEEVPRQFLSVLAGEKRAPFREGSGRLELAKAIADPKNPLTARVFVNRVWMQHFGAGLVRTPSDFGTRSDPPTHPELLDYLATRFVEDGWSVKKLHRQILLSAAYQQSSMDNAAGLSKDPENRLLWRMNRRRLDFEQLRDAFLAASGRLSQVQGGRAVELTTAPFSTRRSVYGFIDRQNLPGMFRTFDFASPDTSTPQRHATTVPQQALFLMNSPFALEQARHLAGAPGFAALPPEDRVRTLYRRAYGRSPEAEELALGLEFLRSGEREPKPNEPNANERYAQVLLLANEFAFVD